MDKYWELAIAAVAAVGGWQFVRYVLNLNANRRISAAEAFKEEYKALIEDYQRVQKEVDKQAEKLDKYDRMIDDLYKRVRKLEDEKISLINEKLILKDENNKLRLALKEAEKHICLQPDDKCLKRLNDNVKCRLVGLLRGAYTEDHPGAILTDDDMKKGVTENGKDNGIPEEPREGEQP